MTFARQRMQLGDHNAAGPGCYRKFAVAFAETLVPGGAVWYGAAQSEETQAEPRPVAPARRFRPACRCRHHRGGDCRGIPGGRSLATALACPVPRRFDAAGVIVGIAQAISEAPVSASWCSSRCRFARLRRNRPRPMTGRCSVDRRSRISLTTTRLWSSPRRVTARSNASASACGSDPCGAISTSWSRTTERRLRHSWKSISSLLEAARISARRHRWCARTRPGRHDANPRTAGRHSASRDAASRTAFSTFLIVRSSTHAFKRSRRRRRSCCPTSVNVCSGINRGSSETSVFRVERTTSTSRKDARARLLWRRRFRRGSSISFISARSRFRLFRNA